MTNDKMLQRTNRITSQAEGCDERRRARGRKVQVTFEEKTFNKLRVARGFGLTTSLEFK